MSRLYRLLDWCTNLVFGAEPKKLPEPTPDWVDIGKRPLPGEKNGLLYEARQDRKTGRIQYYIPEANCWV